MRNTRRKNYCFTRGLHRTAAILAAASMALTAPAAAFAEPDVITVQTGEAAEAVVAQAPAPEGAQPDGEAVTTPAQAPEGQPAEGQPAEGQPAEGQPAEGQPADGEAQPEDGEMHIVSAPAGTGETAAEEAAEPALADAMKIVLDNPELIAYGTKVIGIPIGGMTVEEATAAVDAYFQAIQAETVTVNVNGVPVTAPVASFDYQWSVGEIIEDAAKVGKSGGLVSIYRELTDTYYEKADHEIIPTVNPEAVSAFVAEQIIPMNCDPVDATITRENDAFIVTPETNGLATDQEATVNTIVAALSAQVPTLTVDSATTVTPPPLTEALLNSIQDPLGGYSTPILDDSPGRVTNIRTASGRIGNRLVMPGEQLSVSTTILPRTYENGYRTGTQFNNGNNEKVIGGGVCQVSTTLYGALLRAELQIDERHPHSMVIRYSDPSTDAAIANGAKDLVFTNNQETPVYIETFIKKGRLYFNIYGHETRPPERTVEFKSVTVSRRTLSDRVIEDSSKPVGYRSSSGSHHDEVVSYLDKIVKINGEEVSRERVSYDSYEGSRVTTVVGTKQVAPPPDTQPAATE